tara:strand:+ start:51 stop:485 length:435 start_codon:yes stop_codon:yes gene_type:complete
MKVTLEIEHYEDYGHVPGGDKDDNELDIKIDWSQLYINGIEVISEEQINEIGYFLGHSKPRGEDYPTKLIVSLGDDRKLRYGESNDWSLQFGNYATYTFEEIFEMILTEQNTEPIDEEYAINFKKHLIGIYDKTIKNIKKGDTK